MISFSIKKRKIYLPLKKLKTLQYFEKYCVDVERTFKYDVWCLTSFISRIESTKIEFTNINK